MTELLPCPFCGSNKVSLCQWTDTAEPNTTWIECTNCGICQDSFHHDDAEHVKGIAAMMWNTRIATAEVTPYREALRVMQTALEHYVDRQHWNCWYCENGVPHKECADCNYEAGTDGTLVARKALADAAALLNEGEKG